MTGPALSPLGTPLVSVVQWTLVGLEVLVLAYVLAWVMRHTRLRRLAPPFRWRQPAHGEAQVEVARARDGRLVSMGGGPPAPVRPVPAPRGLRAVRPVRGMPGARTPRGVTPVSGSAAVPPPASRPVTRVLHCPACGALLARGEAATRLVTRCTGCDRRVAVRMDDDRVVVTVEG